MSRKLTSRKIPHIKTCHQLLDDHFRFHVRLRHTQDFKPVLLFHYTNGQWPCLWCPQGSKLQKSNKNILVPEKCELIELRVFPNTVNCVSQAVMEDTVGHEHLFHTADLTFSMDFQNCIYFRCFLAKFIQIRQKANVYNCLCSEQKLKCTQKKRTWDNFLEH